MSLSCSCDSGDDYDQFYMVDNNFSVLNTKRGRKCSSCRTRLVPGDKVLRINVFRHPNCDIEDSIYGEGGEVQLRTRYHCADCGAISLAVSMRNMCMEIDENIHRQFDEFMRDHVTEGNK